MRNRRFQFGLVIAAGAAVLGLSAGWAQPAQRFGPKGLVKVQQGVGDAGPLNQDFRIQPLDLRMPMGFDSVYHGQSVNAYGQSSGFFARIDGAVTAVFPQSIYSDNGQGQRTAEVPAGTVFYIGALPPELSGVTDPSLGIETGLPGRAPVHVKPRPPTVLRSTPDSLMELPFDAGLERIAEGRRADAAAELLHQAAEAEKARMRR